MTRGRIHLVGVAGVGMNPLAQVLLAAGHEVSGSDRYVDSGEALDVIPKLRHAGVRFFQQDGSGVTAQTEAVVASTAIEPDNPDLAAAARLGVPVLHRAEMLAKLAEGTECVAVTGTSGKTTVTGMIGFLLEQLGDDPTVVNGGAVVNWETPDAVGNVRVGRSHRWVIEADESDRSLLRFRPDWAVVTNVSADHFPLEQARQLFRAFAGQVKRGVVGLDGDPPRAAGHPPELSADGSSFEYRGQRFRLALLGAHNAENALHAVMLCDRLGHRLDRLADALPLFRGIRRRLEVVATEHGVTVIDDYAHNPSKISAAWQAVAPHHRRVLAVWRPHGFGPLAKMYGELRDLFRRMAESGAWVCLLPVYYAGGTPAASVTSDALVRDLAAAGAPVELAADYGDAARRVAAQARPGDVVLNMGARDPHLPALARRIALALQGRALGAACVAAHSCPAAGSPLDYGAQPGAERGN